MRSDNKTDDIINIQGHIKALLPLLDKNQGLACQEYISGSLAKGAFDVVVTRNSTAHVLANADNINCPLALLKAFSPCLIDVRCYAKEYTSTKVQQVYKDLLELYLEFGFSETDKFFDIPTPNLSLNIQPLYIEQTPEYLEPVTSLPKGTLVTLVTPKKYADFGSAVEINCKEVDIPPSVVKASIKAGVLEMDSTSGNDPELYAIYDTFRVV